MENKKRFETVLTIRYDDGGSTDLVENRKENGIGFSEVSLDHITKSGDKFSQDFVITNSHMTQSFTPMDKTPPQKVVLTADELLYMAHYHIEAKKKSEAALRSTPTGDKMEEHLLRAANKIAAAISELTDYKSCFPEFRKEMDAHRASKGEKELTAEEKTDV